MVIRYISPQDIHDAVRVGALDVFSPELCSQTHIFDIPSSECELSGTTVRGMSGWMRLQNLW